MIGRRWGGERARRVGSSVRYRGVTIGALLIMAAVALIPRLVSAEDPYTQITPKSDRADDIQFLYKVVFWLALLVFIGVQMVIVWTVLRYRRRGDSDERPVQVHGNKTLEIAWTIIPAVILVAIFIPTVQVMYDADADVEGGDYVVEVYGKQWWWEVHYARPDDLADVWTANDIYIPVGRSVTFQLNTANVIHSFYVPQLSGTMDLIPGHTNTIKVTAREPGMYYGECKEFCGTSHAYMRFKVIAVPEQQFNDYIDGYRAGPNSQAAALVDGGDIERIPTAMGLCLGCHNISGVSKNAAGQPYAPGGPLPKGLAGGGESGTTFGPNLSMVACRTALAAGILPNDEEHLRTWLHYPGGVKPGNYMATLIKEGTLPPDQIDQIVAYLKTLSPEGGCPDITGINEDDVIQLAEPAQPPAQAADPEASDPAAAAVPRRPDIGFAA